MKYSNGHFGFSVQKHIYEALGGTWSYNENTEHPIYNETIWTTFGDRVGWRRRGEGWNWWTKEWIKDDDFIFSVNSPKGHLPGGAGRNIVGWDHRIAIFARIKVFASYFFP